MTSDAGKNMGRKSTGREKDIVIIMRYNE